MKGVEKVGRTFWKSQNTITILVGGTTNPVQDLLKKKKTQEKNLPIYIF